MRKLTLTLTLALAALLLPGLSLAETPETPQPAPEAPALTFEGILLGSSCPTESAPWSPPAA